MSRLTREVFFSVPNLLTLGRIAVIPLIMLVMLLQQPAFSLEFNRIMAFTSAALFIAAGITDLVDGYYARRYKMVSLWGKFADPMADKLVHMTAMIMMIPLDRIPAWLVVVLLFREILITGLRSAASGEGIIIDAGSWGKKKTAWFNCGLSALLLHYDVFGVSSITVGWFCMVVGIFYSMASAVQYIKYFIREVNKRKTEAV